jgi:hypothetical protein
MDKLRELIDVLSDKRVQARTVQARQQRICKICQNPVDTFETDISREEYRLSTICETCQRYYYIHID